MDDHVTRRPSGGKGQTVPSFTPEHLRSLATRVRRLGHGGRGNPIEHFVVEKCSLARELELLADRAGGIR